MIKPKTSPPKIGGFFSPFANLVAASFQEIVAQPNVFVTVSDADVLYVAYLAAFPEGTNTFMKSRTEHDCSTCKQFVRRVGSVVSVDEHGKVSTAWDRAAESAPHPYNIVATKMRDLVRTAGISNLFRVGEKELSFGTQQTRSMDAVTKVVSTNDHFYTGEVPKRFRVASPDQERGDYRTTVQVFGRGLTELLPEAVDTVLSLIEANALYRGEEHKKAVAEFRAAQLAFAALDQAARPAFLWRNALGPAARFRNTVIGTLVQDLSAGIDVEAAVKSFEKKVAPENYKRTTALITPGMVRKAMEVVAELGLEPALERRFAVIGDVSVRDLLWVDGSAKPLMKGGIGDKLMQHAVAVAPKSTGQDEERAELIKIDDFVAKVLPSATSLEIVFKSEHLGNLVSMTAPVHPESKQLFRWSNDFAWSYSGNVADSYLRKQVQTLGGRVDGVLRFSHMWNHDKRNASLMDLHVFMPGSTHHMDGCHNTYPEGQRVGWNCRKDAVSGGVQDVDYTAAAPEGYVPVENITFPTLSKLRDGQYTFKIHNWQLREPTKGGFLAEVEFSGKVFQYDHPEPLKYHEWITVAVATLKAGVFTIEHRHPVGSKGQAQWGLTTGNYVKVNAVTLSPNYWGENRVGNKHTIFFVDGCHSDEATRGIYNEFLHPRLEAHRKVFEVIGDKTKCQPTEGQLSGLGFSSTKRDSFIIRVGSGKSRRLYNVQVGS